jgi:hypothetical protein
MNELKNIDLIIIKNDILVFLIKNGVIIVPRPFANNVAYAAPLIPYILMK